MESDILGVSVPQIPEELLTKRIVLRIIASVYNPLGLVSPVLITGKILLQDVWSKEL